LNNKLFEHVSEVEYLGITISHDLKWNTRIEAACSKARGTCILGGWQALGLGVLCLFGVLG